MKTSKLIITISCLLLFLTVNFSYSQDWPQFRGINRDSKVEGFKAPSAWPADLKQEWKIEVGTGDASPVLSGSKIYIHTRKGDQEVVSCLDSKSGKEIWKDQYACIAVTGAAASHPGPRSTPVVTGGKLVTLGVSAILSCYDASTGKLLWRKDNPTGAVPQFFTGLSPLVVDNLCIVHLGTKDKGEILALDITSGKEKWKWNGEGPAYASPSVMKIDSRKHIICITEKNILALDVADGKLVWQIATPPQQRFYNAASPVIDGNIIYYTGQGSGTVCVKVEKSGGGFSTTELWKNSELGTKWNTPVLKNGFLFGFSDQKRIFCMNASTGQTSFVDNVVNSDFSTVSDCGSVLIGLASTGNLIVFSPESSKYSEVAKYKVAETPVYAFPVIAREYIYVKDAESLIQFSIK
ncbi:MAG TPA: PQQ-binding-like beta-propeller repeat protein [Bacteroidales bacterium]|nr:PQQ-binding-like beta-propeller repeat protein [Bacteroidales bacterium]